MAVAAAERLAFSSRVDTASSFASLMRELRACLDAALEGSKIADDPLDEIRARRQRKMSSGL
jgi:hypothetical protein